MNALPVANIARRARLRFGIAGADENGVEDGLRVAGHELSENVTHGPLKFENGYAVLTFGKKYQPA